MISNCPFDQIGLIGNYCPECNRSYFDSKEMMVVPDIRSNRLTQWLYIENSNNDPYDLIRRMASALKHLENLTMKRGDPIIQSLINEYEGTKNPEEVCQKN